MKKIYLLFSVILSCSSLSYSQQGDNNSLLWRIQGKGIDSPSYLFGTIHLPQKKFVTYSDSVYTAIQNTRMFYNEVDFLNQQMFGDTSLMNFFIEKKEYLDSIQKSDDWKRMIDRVNKKYDEHLVYDSTDQFLEFSQRFTSSIFQPEDGVTLPDIMLAGYATLLGKKTGGLETYRFQFNMMYEMLEARLKDTTMQMEDEMIFTEGLKRFYIDEKIDSIGWIVEKISQGYRELVFDRRNKTMADSMEKHMAEKPSFFAVGAGHLGGSHGVIEVLRSRGFTLTPVHSSNKMSILVINNMLKMSADAQKKAKKEGKDALNEFRIYTDGIKDELMEGVQEPPSPPPPSKKVQVSKQPAKAKSKNKPAPWPHNPPKGDFGTPL